MRVPVTVTITKETHTYLKHLSEMKNKTMVDIIRSAMDYVNRNDVQYTYSTPKKVETFKIDLPDDVASKVRKITKKEWYKYDFQMMDSLMKKGIFDIS